MARRLFAFLVICAFALVFLIAWWLFAGDSPSSTPAGADPLPVCNEGGTISTNTTWNASCVHVVSGITVSTGATLTVEPGTVVKFSGSGAGIAVIGSLLADGTLEQPVTFTSFKDDTAGGDTNGDGTASSPAPGDWATILARDTSSGGASITLNHARAAYGGNTPSSDFGIITNRDSSVGTDPEATISLNNSTVASSSSAGVYVENASSAVNVDSSTFTANTTDGLWVSGVAPVITNNSFTNNGAAAATVSVSSGGIENGARELDVQHLLGHSTPAMVRRYSATYDAEKAARAHEQFSPADRMGERMR